MGNPSKRKRIKVYGQPDLVLPRTPQELAFDAGQRPEDTRLRRDFQLQQVQGGTALLLRAL